MPVTTNVLRPGLLVSLKTSLTGNVSYIKREIAPETVSDEGTAEATWQTTRVVANKMEREAGRKAQADARAAVTKVCTTTAFGLLCPEADSEKLERALVQAREIAKAFNATAQTSNLRVYVIAGKIAADDVEAVKAINAEVQQYIAMMKEGIQNADADAIRKAANEARRLGAMLTAEAAGRVQVALSTARAAAREIVKVGDDAAVEVDRAAIARLEECRLSFLDLEDAQVMEAPQMEGRSVDLSMAQDYAVTAINTAEEDRLADEDRQLELEERINLNMANLARAIVGRK